MSNSVKVPDGWGSKTIKDLASVITKGTTPTTYGNEYVSYGVNFLRVENINENGRVNLKNLKFIDHKTNDSLKRSQLQEGDLLFSIAGAIGRTAMVEKVILPANTNQAIGIIRLNEGCVDKHFLRLGISGPIIQRQISQIQAGLAQSNLNLQQLGELKILLPPLPEQKKIASILTSVDDVIEKTEAQISKLQDLKKGMMTELLTKGIGHTEFKDSPVGRIPKSWGTISLRELTLESAFGPRFSSDLYSDQGAVGCIRTTDFDVSWDINYSTVPLADLKLDDVKQHLLKEDDLLITRSGSCGIVDVYKVQKKPMIPGAFIIRFRLKDTIHPHFLRCILMTDSFQERIQMLASGGVQKNLSGTNLKTLMVPMPPIIEQNKIVDAINSISTGIKTKNSRLTQTKSLKKSLMNDLLTGKKRVKINN